MSDAESTIRSCILSGYAEATGKPNEVEARVDAIIKSIFHSSVQWAIKEYLEEVKGGEAK